MHPNLIRKDTDCEHGVPPGMGCALCPQTDSGRKAELSGLLRNTVNDIINSRIKETGCTGTEARKAVLKMLISVTAITKEQIYEGEDQEKKYRHKTARKVGGMP